MSPPSTESKDGKFLLCFPLLAVHHSSSRRLKMGLPTSHNRTYGPSCGIHHPRAGRYTATWTSDVKNCAAKLGLAFGSENGEEMAVPVSEVRDPVCWRGLVRFGDKGNSLNDQGPVGRSYCLHLEDNFCCPGERNAGLRRIACLRRRADIHRTCPYPGPQTAFWEITITTNPESLSLQFYSKTMVSKTVVAAELHSRACASPELRAPLK
jgi:hypothetical protein